MTLVFNFSKEAYMNKIILKSAMLLALSGMLFSCNNASNPRGRVSMIATVSEINDRLVVEVTESEYTFGTHWVIITDTVFYDKSGNEVTKDAIKVGNSVKIQYSGQVMLSYPPQIVAASITILS